MKNNNSALIVVLLLFVATTCYSQSKYGNATIEELNMSHYENDSTASAVILLREGDSNFVYDENKGFRFEYSLKTKIKILTTEGLDYCNEQISYYEEDSRSKEEIRGLSGTTYNVEDGKIVKTKLTKEYIFDEDVDNRWKLKKFTLPAAKVGSVIEYKYTIVSDFFYELRDFRFQSNIPTQYTSFESIIPEYFTYNVNMQGFESLDSKREAENKSFTIYYRDDSGRRQSGYVTCTAEKISIKGNNIPALKKEPYVWCMNDYVSKISFELQRVQMPYSMSTNYTSKWEDIDERLFKSDSFGGNLKKTGLLKDQISKMDPTVENAGQILTQIKGLAKWDERSRLYPSNLKETLKTGLGKSADINFLLINALKVAGFEVYPVILSTRSNGRIPISHPSLSAFNYTITAVKIDTLTLFTDASDKYGSWNLLPEKCMVTQARMLNPDGRSSWVDLSTIGLARSMTSGEFYFEGSKYKGKISQAKNDIAAHVFKKNYFEEHKSKEDYVEKLSSLLSAEVENFEITGVEIPGENVKISYIAEKDMVLGDEYLYINPMSEKFYSENPFRGETRKYPINFSYLSNYYQTTSISIPEGYSVEELPKNEKISTEDNSLSMTYRIAQVNNKVSMSLNFRANQLFFSQDNYKALKDFFARVALKNSEQMVLKKISE